MEERIPATFLNYAVGILADTTHGLTGSKIVEYTSAFAIDYNVNLPHSHYPFEAANKRTALRDNLLSFRPAIQYKILKYLCDLPQFIGKAEIKDLRIKLASRFAPLFEPDAAELVSEPLVAETKHWLEGYEPSFRLYANAEEKYRGGVFSRNLLDDLRLSLESLLKHVLQNSKSLENQISPVGSLLAAKGGSPELRNMFMKLLDHYTKYQNTYVKHDDAVIEEEIEIVFELTSSFIKHLVRLHERAQRRGRKIMVIHRLIPERHITTLTDGFLHFSPCDRFVDQLEFRFGYCRDAFEIGGDEALARCVRASFNDPGVERKIANTSISCWSRHPQERAFMWEVYGKSQPAILIVSDDGALQTHVRQIKGTETTSAGPVRYHFFTSQVFPEFVAPPSNSDLRVDFDLFFEKHGFYEYEKEFRIVIAERGPVMIPLADDLIQRVILSPFGHLQPANLSLLQEKFAGRVAPSSIQLPYGA